jgi:transcriptional regulator with XRE-family HTH domain
VGNCSGCPKVAVVPTVANLLRARIKELRLARGLTQEQYAESCGIPYKVLQHLERGRRANPRLSTLEKLAKGAGVSVFDLFAPEMPLVRELPKRPLPPHNRKRVKKTS